MASGMIFDECLSLLRSGEAKCFGCGANKRLHMHDLNYRNYRNRLLAEKNDTFVILCPDCHLKEHRGG